MQKEENLSKKGEGVGSKYLYGGKEEIIFRRSCMGEAQKKIFSRFSTQNIDLSSCIYVTKIARAPVFTYIERDSNYAAKYVPVARVV